MQVLYWLEDIRTPALDKFFSLITLFGEETLFLALSIIMFWCVSKRNGYFMLTVGLLGTVLNQFLKLICRIPRPWVKDPNFTIVESARAAADGYSFPSGHTQSATAALGAPARFVKCRWMQTALIVLTLLVGLSRMYLGVHTPADVGVSLVLGSIMVLVFYPFFQKSDEKPACLYGMIGLLLACSAVYLCFVYFNNWPADIDAHNLESGVKNAWLLLGCSLGMLVACPLERKYIRFDVKAPLWAQIVKTVIGLILVLGLKSGLKPVLNLLFSGHIAATAPRYFLIVLFSVCVWPLTFGWFAKGCPIGRKK